MIKVLGFSNINSEKVTLLTKSQLISQANYTFDFKSEVDYAREKLTLRNAAHMCGISKFVILRDLNDGEMTSIAILRGFINHSDINTYKRIIDADKM